MLSCDDELKALGDQVIEQNIQRETQITNLEHQVVVNERLVA